VVTVTALVVGGEKESVDVAAGHAWDAEMLADAPLTFAVKSGVPLARGKKLICQPGVDAEILIVCWAVDQVTAFDTARGPVGSNVAEGETFSAEKSSPTDEVALIPVGSAPKRLFQDAHDPTSVYRAAVKVWVEDPGVTVADAVVDDAVSVTCAVEHVGVNVSPAGRGPVPLDEHVLGRVLVPTWEISSTPAGVEANAAPGRTVTPALRSLLMPETWALTAASVPSADAETGAR